MATLSNTSLQVAGPFNPTKTILGASDVITFTSSTNQMLLMYNITASPVVVTLDGASGTTVSLASLGLGSTTASVASGLAITVPADGFTVVRLDTVSAYCNGVVALTGGTGIIASIIY